VGLVQKLSAPSTSNNMVMEEIPPDDWFLQRPFLKPFNWISFLV
jgi:hypothetical protein